MNTDDDDDEENNLAFLAVPLSHPMLRPSGQLTTTFGLQLQKKQCQKEISGAFFYNNLNLAAQKKQSQKQIYWGLLL